MPSTLNHMRTFLAKIEIDPFDSNLGVDRDGCDVANMQRGIDRTRKLGIGTTPANVDMAQQKVHMKISINARVNFTTLRGTTDGMLCTEAAYALAHAV